MNRRFLILIFFVLLTSCDSSSTDSTSGHSNEKQTVIIPINDIVEENFNDFIGKFSIDSAFQISRIRFPLKTKLYNIDHDRDSLIYEERSGFEMMDFRRGKSNSRYGQWEQRIIVDKNNRSAKIEIRGIENGIMLTCLFEKVDKVWMLIEIDDSST